MQLSVQTSELLQLKLKDDLFQKHIDQVKAALRSKDFDTLSRVIMQESNQLHAICLDTLPAIFYMN